MSTEFQDKIPTAVRDMQQNSQYTTMFITSYAVRFTTYFLGVLALTLSIFCFISYFTGNFSLITLFPMEVNTAQDVESSKILDLFVGCCSLVLFLLAIGINHAAREILERNDYISDLEEWIRIRKKSL